MNPAERRAKLLVQKVRQAIAISIFQNVEVDVRAQQMTDDELDAMSSAAIAIALEEAAKVAEAHEDDMGHGKGAIIAAAIRALKSS